MEAKIKQERKIKRLEDEVDSTLAYNMEKWKVNREVEAIKQGSNQEQLIRLNKQLSQL